MLGANTLNQLTGNKAGLSFTDRRKWDTNQDSNDIDRQGHVRYEPKLILQQVWEKQYVGLKKIGRLFKTMLNLHRESSAVRYIRKQEK